ncbi:hypothetical protein DCC39_11540 [Pueribacillus theae]|uniref:Calcineurin-like phosphoesterase domain-containing protein n=1 Tax=Pueribacillus theae TaxID=2171751 RepID=A0A2U1JYN9_9BACI|nr:metallophosphoesterase [Pueribacillus theae]PWA10341.1 hypothetical protein DCC39_11540 [Pueribacillus theae]
MTELKFLHVTDTHILQNKQDGLYQVLDRPNENPVDQFKKVLNYANAMSDSLDFILISGDLVHEGGVEDYRFFKKLIEETTTLPVYVALGNHDVTEAYWEGYENILNCQDNLFYEKTIRGYRMVVLDSSHDKSGIGMVDARQLSWLEEILQSPAEKGTFIVVHHPPEVGEFSGIHHLKNSDELMAKIKNTDVMAVLSGHTHQNKISLFKNICISVAEGTAFGVELTDEHMHITNKVGFNLCTLNENGIDIRQMRMPEELTTLSSIEMKKVLHS